MKRAMLCVAMLLSVQFSYADEAPKLFDSLGGMDAIKAVVDDFVSRCAHDKRINKFFAKTAADPARLNSFKENLVNQICEAAGGPCKYTGRDMKTAHAGMHIRSKDFDTLVEDLTFTLKKFKVKDSDRDALLSVLGPMKKDIVTASGRGVASEHHHSSKRSMGQAPGKK